MLAMHIVYMCVCRDCILYRWLRDCRQISREFISIEAVAAAAGVWQATGRMRVFNLWRQRALLLHCCNLWVSSVECASGWVGGTGWTGFCFLGVTSLRHFGHCLWPHTHTSKHTRAVTHNDIVKRQIAWHNLCVRQKVWPALKLKLKVNERSFQAYFVEYLKFFFISCISCKISKFFRLSVSAFNKLDRENHINISQLKCLWQSFLTWQFHHQYQKWSAAFECPGIWL